MKESRQRIVRLRIPESTSAVDRPRERKPDGDGGTRGPHAKRIWPLTGVPWPEIAHVSPMKQRKTIRLTLDVSEEFYARLESLTERVEAESKSSVIRDALRLWEQREELRELEIARLKRAYDEGVASGPGREIDPGAFLAELKAKRRSRG